VSGDSSPECKPAEHITPPVSTTSSPTLASGSAQDDSNHTELGSDLYPDIFVLGFQELDLSTEALLYNVSTAREDAWCLALFAALGEKAILYEKVSTHIVVSPCQ
jgi:phosphatidylinositol-bisphosphatase